MDRQALVQQKIVLDQQHLRELCLLKEEEEAVARAAKKQVELSNEEPLVLPEDVSAKIDTTVQEIFSNQENEKIKLNVGGRVFVTTKQTLTGRECLFKTMLGTSIPLDTDDDGAIKMEEHHDPQLFSIILEHLQTGRTRDIGVPTHDIELLRALVNESRYFGTEDLTKYVLRIIEMHTLMREPKPGEYTEEMAAQEEIQHEDIEPQEYFVSEDDWLQKLKQIVSQSKIDSEKYIEQRRKQLEETKAQLTSRKEDNLPLKLNIGGTRFDIQFSELVEHEESLLYVLYKQLENKKKLDEITFIDRDPVVFEWVHVYLQKGTFDHIPIEDFNQKRLLREARHYNIPKLIQYFDPTRYPLESLGKQNIRMKREEDMIRNMFAQDRENPILNDPYLSLLPIFDVVKTFKREDTTGIPLLFDFELPVSKGKNTYNDNEIYKRFVKKDNPHFVHSMDAFKEQFHAFTTGLFTGVDWTNMVAAGGSVLAALYKQTDIDAIVTFFHNRIFDMTNGNYDRKDIGGFDEDFTDLIPDVEDEEDVFSDNSDGDKYETSDIAHKAKTYIDSHEKLEEWASSRTNKLMANYLYGPWNGSDIDLFLYAMTEQEAENKIRHLYDTFKANLSNPANQGRYITMLNDLSERDCYQEQDIFMVRTRASVTFHFKYPIRPIQVILRLYKSPAEILMGFDIDCCCIAYDGINLWALPRCRRALNTRMNLVDVDRQSTTYEIRLAKYAKRGFRVGVPGLDMRLVTTKLGRFARSMETSRDEDEKPPAVDSGLAYLLHLELRAKCMGMHRMFVFQRFYDIPNEEERQEALRNMKPEVTVSAIRDKIDFKQKRRRGYYNRNRQKDKLSDYESFFIPFTAASTPQTLFARMSYSVRLIRETLKQTEYKPDILFTLNNVEQIINNQDEQASVITGPIQWLKLNPGTQMVGSFNPVSRNFYAAAYARSEQSKKELADTVQMLREWKAKRKIIKVQWYVEESEGNWVPYDADSNNILETTYRDQKQMRYNYGPASVKGGFVDVKRMTQQPERYTSNTSSKKVKRVKSIPEKTEDSQMHD